MAAADSAVEVGLPAALRLGDEAFALYGERALYWPAADALLVADLHLGKGEVFRRAGIGVPRGGTAADLARLSALLAATGAGRLLVLGDLLHGALHESAGWRSDWQAFRERHTDVCIDVLAGNHDRALRDADAFENAAVLGVRLLQDGTIERGITLCHEPRHASNGAASLCGHLHPAQHINGLGRLPAFWWRAGQRQLVLPAFSTFTGRIAQRPAAGDALFACAGHRVLPAVRY